MKEKKTKPKASKKTSKKASQLLPYTHATIISVLAFTTAVGGYGGYEVHKKYGNYVTEFDNRYHEVTEVIDGDTIRLSDGTVIRLLGIDAPEDGSCYAVKAADELTKLVSGQQIFLDSDVEGVDQIGRLLRYVFIKGSNPEGGNSMVNYSLITSGHAQSLFIAPNRRYVGLFEAGENKAQDTSKGIWGACSEVIAEERMPRQQSIEAPSENCLIKGNVSEKIYGKKYFLPGCSNYNVVKIDPTKGEAWFCTESEASSAGFTKSGTCPEDD